MTLIFAINIAAAAMLGLILATVMLAARRLPPHDGDRRATTSTVPGKEPIGAAAPRRAHPVRTPQVALDS